MTIRFPNGFIIVPTDATSINSIAYASSIQIVKGHAKAVDWPEYSSKPYYGGLTFHGKLNGPGSVDRNFDSSVENRLDWAIANKHINKSKFDDRKLRFDGYSLKEGVLVLLFGPSHFEEHAATNVRAINDATFHGELSAMGVRDYNDPFAYFANNLALNVVLQTGDCKYVIGKRSEAAQLYPGFWHNIGEFADSAAILGLFNLDDHGARIREAFRSAMKKELLEEASIEELTVSDLREIGVSYGISSVDLNYDAQTSVDSEYIRTKGHFKGKDKDEHSGFVGVSFEDLIEVLAGKKIFDLKSPTGVIDRPDKAPASNIVPIGRGGMLIHVGIRERAALDYILKQPQYQYPI